jgi:hypothetical protein
VQRFEPPDPFAAPPGTCAVFLAGSIEMGVAEHWQARLAEALRGYAVVVLDPRRADWDASWRQSIDDPQFRTQVEWELAGLDRADVIAMWFDPATKSPITLLELGLHARGGKLVIGCPHGFWRRGNLEIVAQRYAIPLHATWDAFVDDVLARAAATDSTPASP